KGCPGAVANSVCAIRNPSCFSRCLRVPIAIARFYGQYLWIPQTFLPTNPDLHHGLLRVGLNVELDRKEKWSLSPYFEFPLNHFTRITEIKNLVGVDLSYNF